MQTNILKVLQAGTCKFCARHEYGDAIQNICFVWLCGISKVFCCFLLLIRHAPF